MVCDPFNAMLDLVCKYFVEHFSPTFISDVSMYISFFVVSLSGFGIGVTVAS